MRKKRCNQTIAFKTKDAKAAIKEDKTISGIASE